MLLKGALLKSGLGEDRDVEHVIHGLGVQRQSSQLIGTVL